MRLRHYSCPAAFTGLGLLVAAMPAIAQSPAQPDPQMSVVLNELKMISGTPFYKLSPPAARQQFAAEDAAKIVARETHVADAAEPVGRVIDQMIPGPGGALPIRIYTPNGSGPSGFLPVIDRLSLSSETRKAILC